MSEPTRPYVGDVPILGWKEQGSLPDLGVKRLRMKLDTGAKRSALHVVDLREVGTHILNGQELPVVAFGVHVGRRDSPRTVEATANVIRYRVVRESSAYTEKRPVIRTRLRCGPVDVQTDVTLTSRHGMNFRMLIGRVTLDGVAIVDPTHGYLHTKRPRRRKPTEEPS